MKRILKYAAYLLAFLAAAGAGGILWLRTSLPPAEREISDPLLRGTVEVLFDEREVPYIFAENRRDAAFALGFAHAENRLWQMESQRRLAAGRLSELLGSRTVGVDRFMRTLGLYRSAEASFAGLEPATKAVLEAYAAGVNRWLETRSGALPPEFVALRHEPESWRPADSLVWGKLMALRLSGNFQDELRRLRAMNAGLDLERLRELWPAYPGDGPVTGEGRRAAANPGYVGRLTAATAEVVPRFQGASNSWAIGGARTRSGKPLLANDPHLGFGAPILWYLAKIVTPEGTLTGATVPGVPLHVLGHTDGLAWGMTTTQTDLQDLYVETLDPERPDHYLTPDGPRPFETRVETLDVRDGEPVTFTVRSTHRGPVISDLEPGGNPVISLQAVFLRGADTTAQSVLKLNRARNAGELRTALRDFKAPQQNVVYADTNGVFGFISSGAVPIRKSGRGFIPGDGASGEADWTGVIPFDELPQSENPAEGFVANANNKVTPEGYPYFVTVDWTAPYRARRIVETLRNLEAATAEKMTGLQMDSVSLAARDLIPLMLNFQTRDAGLQEVMDLLRRWDGGMNVDRPEPLIFDRWLRSLNRELYADDLGGAFGEFWRARAVFIRNVLSGVSPSWCDDVATRARETCAAALEASLKATLAELSEATGTSNPARWRWGDHHVARFRHQLFQHVPVVRMLTDLSIPTSGGNFTVNRGTTRMRNPRAPHDHIHGAGYRGVYDLADLSRSRFVIATGQSGNPFSSHYRDFLPLWASGGHVTLDKTKRQLEQSAARRHTFRPRR